MSDRVDVLDHGFVRLVSSMGDDLSISRAARVSYDAPAREEDRGLIKYLMKNKHTSPFEAVVFTFEVKAPIFVFRQWHRHRTWSYNEVSARYTALPSEFYVPTPRSIGKQSTDNKQMRVPLDPDDITGVVRAQRFSHLIRKHCEQAHELYLDLLEYECPRELARGVLSLNTYSRMFATVDLHNLLHFITLRNHEHSQYEIQVYAQALRTLIETIVPLTIEAYDEWNT